MNQSRHPDDFESENYPSGSDHCSLLDDYWDALRGKSRLDLRCFVEQHRSDASIAGDLEVLNLLYQVCTGGPADGDASDPQTACLSTTVVKASGSRGGHNMDGGTPSRGETPRTPQLPERIGKYMVVELIGQGGQGQVFRVFHPELGKECALKLARWPIAIGDQAGRDALKNEARILAKCDHPNLVRVFDLDVHEGRPFVVMDFVKGRTLKQLVAQGLFGRRRAAQVVMELARAVAYLHDQGIVHQDIKPQNVLVDEQDRPRLIDLGMARQNHAWRDDVDERTGGTYAYMSPEQAQGRGHLISERTDVFGLGGLLYFLLTSRPLYVGSSRAMVVRLALEADYSPVRELNPKSSRSLERICDKALAADPEQRYSSAAELEGALRRYLNRAPIVKAAGLLALVILAAAVLFVLWASPRPPASELTTSPLPAPAPLKLDALEVLHYRIGTNSEDDVFGPIGHSTEPIRQDDRVSVSGQLDMPAYCYVVALTPDGEHRLYWPEKESDVPSLSAEIGSDELAFPLTDGLGLQAFVVVASRNELPPFKDWSGRDSLRNLWKRATVDDVHGVWEYKEGTVRPIWSASRIPVEKRALSAPAAFRDVCAYLDKISDCEAIQAIAFPVKPRLLVLVTPATQVPPEKAGGPASKAPGQCVLLGDDAKQAVELEKAVAAALKANHWEEAVASEARLHDLRSRVQGEKHFQTLDEQWRLRALRTLPKCRKWIVTPIYRPAQ